MVAAAAADSDARRCMLVGWVADRTYRQTYKRVALSKAINELTVTAAAAAAGSRARCHFRTRNKLEYESTRLFGEPGAGS